MAPHYNAPIYKLMDSELNCDFYIGFENECSIKLMTYESLNGFINKIANKKLFGNFYWQPAAIKIAFKQYEQYIITGEPFCISTWIILMLNRLTGKKTYLWSHGWYGNETLIKKCAKKIFFGLAYKVLLYGDYARDIMIKEGFNAEKLRTIYNSLDYSKQIEIRESLVESIIYKDHFKNGNPVLLYIGRIQSRKKIELLIEALYELQKSQIFCNLILIGKQTDETNIQKLVAIYNIEKYVWFFGPCYNENILGELIYNADVCVSPGNVGLTAIHCLAYGTPVITQNNFTHQMPEFEAIKPKLTGDFFVENSVSDLISKIKDWINISKEQRNCIREKCYIEINEKYNPKKQIIIIKNALKM